MNETGRKHQRYFFISIAIALIILMPAVIYEKTHPDFDETISGKEATVVSEFATIHYDEPLGHHTAIVAQSQKIELTGKIAHYLQNNIPMMEFRLNDNSFAWISKKDIVISE